MTNDAVVGRSFVLDEAAKAAAAEDGDHRLRPGEHVGLPAAFPSDHHHRMAAVAVAAAAAGASPPRYEPLKRKRAGSDDDRRKRQKVSIACIQCHKHKRKCDHRRPCRECFSRGITFECVDRPHKRGGRPKNPHGNPYFANGAMDSPRGSGSHTPSTSSTPRSGYTIPGNISSDQRQFLEVAFLSNSSPSGLQMQAIAKKLKMDATTVAVWFANERQSQGSASRRDTRSPSRSASPPPSAHALPPPFLSQRSSEASRDNHAASSSASAVSNNASSSSSHRKMALPPFVEEMRLKDPKTFEQLTLLFYQQQLASGDSKPSALPPAASPARAEDVGAGDRSPSLHRHPFAGTSTSHRSQSEEGESPPASSSSSNGRPRSASSLVPRAFPPHRVPPHAFVRPPFSQSPERPSFGDERKPPFVASPPSASVARKLAQGSATSAGKNGYRRKASCYQCHKRKQKCEDARPCFRCVDRGIAHECADRESKRYPHSNDAAAVRRSSPIPSNPLRQQANDSSDNCSRKRRSSIDFQPSMLDLRSRFGEDAAAETPAAMPSASSVAAAAIPPPAKRAKYYTPEEVAQVPMPRSSEGGSQERGAPRRRKRLAAACAHCHRLKQKCEERRPCFRCIERGKPEDCISRDRTVPKRAPHNGSPLAAPADAEDVPSVPFYPPLTPAAVATADAASSTPYAGYRVNLPAAFPAHLTPAASADHAPASPPLPAAALPRSVESMPRPVTVPKTEPDSSQPPARGPMPALEQVFSPRATSIASILANIGPPSSSNSDFTEEKHASGSREPTMARDRDHRDRSTSIDSQTSHDSRGRSSASAAAAHSLPNSDVDLTMAERERSMSAASSSSHMQDGIGGQLPKPRRLASACAQCHKIKRSCDPGRPCMRCTQRGIADQCSNRERGAAALKSGHARKRRRGDSDASSTSTSSMREDGDVPLPSLPVGSFGHFPVFSAASTAPGFPSAVAATSSTSSSRASGADVLHRDQRAASASDKEPDAESVATNGSLWEGHHPPPAFKKQKGVGACLQCHKVKRGCDQERPCSRCVKRNLADQCCDRMAAVPSSRSASAPKDTDADSEAEEANTNSLHMNGRHSTSSSHSRSASPASGYREPFPRPVAMPHMSMFPSLRTSSKLGRSFPSPHVAPAVPAPSAAVEARMRMLAAASPMPATGGHRQTIAERFGAITPRTAAHDVASSVAAHAASIPVAKQRRAFAACASCHKRKQGCDSQRPCFRCVQRGVPHECVDRPSKGAPRHVWHTQSPTKDEASGVDRAASGGDLPSASARGADSVSNGHREAGTAVVANGSSHSPRVKAEPSNFAASPSLAESHAAVWSMAKMADSAAPAAIVPNFAAPPSSLFDMMTASSSFASSSPNGLHGAAAAADTAAGGTAAASSAHERAHREALAAAMRAATAAGLQQQSHTAAVAALSAVDLRHAAGSGAAAAASSYAPPVRLQAPHALSMGRRVQRACQECRRRKQACDMSRPCGRCVKRGEADMCSDAVAVPRASAAAARSRAN